MNNKIEVVNELVKLGYQLGSESVENFAARFSLEDLKMFLDNFKMWRS